MSKQREILTHLQQLHDMQEIMESMKALAFMEAHKVSRFIDAQQQSVLTIETVAADFLQSYPNLRPAPSASSRLLLLIGSERGFCGDFNEALVARVAAHPKATLIAVGQKLHTLLPEHAGPSHLLPGANVADEVPGILANISDTLMTLNAAQGFCPLEVICHQDPRAGARSVTLIPPFARLSNASAPYRPAPRLTLDPAVFFSALIERYLLAALTAALYASLRSECQRRVQHLAGAVQHIEERTEHLSQRSRTLRQEQITEEIEVILLSVGEQSIAF